MGPQNARAHAVDRGDPRVIDREGLAVHTLRDKGRPNTLSNLSGGVTGEGDGHDLVHAGGEGARLLGEGPEDAPCEGEGLA